MMQRIYVRYIVDRVENGLRRGGQVQKHFAVIGGVVDAITQTYCHLVCNYSLHIVQKYDR